MHFPADFPWHAPTAAAATRTDKIECPLPSHRCQDVVQLDPQIILLGVLRENLLHERVNDLQLQLAACPSPR